MLEMLVKSAWKLNTWSFYLATSRELAMMLQGTVDKNINAASEMQNNFWCLFEMFNFPS